VIVKVLPWRPRLPRVRAVPAPAIRPSSMGSYGRRARYLPPDVSQLGTRQRTAAGHVVEVCDMGMAPPGPWAGQRLYREVRGLDLLGSELIPEADLDFID
jgi:hypothetical protein